MIAWLNGKVQDIHANVVTLDVQGVGYEVRCTKTTLENLQLGSNKQLIIYTEIREDAFNLYGFADQIEKQVFQLLLKVKGVGPKSASEILSNVDKKELLKVIGSGDLNQLQNLKGIGKKTAERIVVELRDKVGEFLIDSGALSSKIEKIDSDSVNDAISALVALGFSKKSAEFAISKFDSNQIKEMSSGDIVKAAFKYL
jgi:Holliday junction DNA helicase RuvA